MKSALSNKKIKARLRFPEEYGRCDSDTFLKSWDKFISELVSDAPQMCLHRSVQFYAFVKRLFKNALPRFLFFFTSKCRRHV